MRNRGRIDGDQGGVQNQIVAALRDAGRSVWITSGCGGGAPDLVVGYGHRNLMLEIKDGSKPPSRRQLTADERRFKDNWKGHYAVVETVDEALRAAGVVR